MSGFFGFFICCIATVMMFGSGNMILGMIGALFMFIAFFTWGISLRLTRGRDVRKLRRMRARMLLEGKSPEEIRKALKSEMSSVEAVTAPVPRWVSILNFAAIAGGVIILIYAVAGKL